MRNIIFTLILLLGSVCSGNAYSTLLFDFEGSCNTDCSRFGLADGTSFSEHGVLGLYDGTATSSGSILSLSDIEFFTFRGIDFLAGNALYSGATIAPVSFVADGILGGFMLAGGTNGTCYDVAFACDNSFSTFIDNDHSTYSIHGPAQFGEAYTQKATLAAILVPEPASIALLGLGLVGIVFARRVNAAQSNTLRDAALRKS